MLRLKASISLRREGLRLLLLYLEARRNNKQKLFGRGAKFLGLAAPTKEFFNVGSSLPRLCAI